MSDRVLVSFCLFGKDPNDIYYGGMLENLRMYSEWQPTWTCRIYLGDSVPKSVAIDLASHENTDIIHKKGHPENQTSTFWRFDALAEQGFDVILFRDADSRPILREQRAVEEFLASDREFHVMRDHPRHGMPILAGLWGARSPRKNKIFKLFPRDPSQDYYLVEQDFLRRNIWGIARKSVIQHVGWDKWSFKTPHLPFPVPRSQEGFVGEGFFADGRPRFPLHRFELQDKNVLGW